MRALPFVLLLAGLVGCQSESTARELLEKDGYTDIVLKKQKDGFDFTAKKGDQNCEGTVSAKGFTGSMQTSMDASCAPTVHPCSVEYPAKCFDDGLAAKKTDPVKAAELYQKGCDGKNAGCCTNLGVAYHTGSGVAKDEAKASELDGRGCDLGDKTGCHNLAIDYRDGTGVARDPVKAFAAFQKSCDKGDPGACGEVGAALVDGTGTTKDAAKGRELLQKACDQKVPTACTNLGLAVFNGEGGSADKAKGAELWRSACDLDNAVACRNLGVAARDKEIPDPDNKQAAWDEKACTLGDGGGCVEIGLHCEHGDAGVAKDPVKAMGFYDKACKLETDVGCFDLGNGKTQGLGGPVDMKAAAEAFDRACKLGYGKACARAKAIPH